MYVAVGYYEVLVDEKKGIFHRDYYGREFKFNNKKEAKDFINKKNEEYNKCQQCMKNKIKSLSRYHPDEDENLCTYGDSLMRYELMEI